MHKIANEKKIYIDYQHSDYNLKVGELLAKYSDAFICSDQVNRIEYRFTRVIESSITKNTKLKSVENE